MLGRKLELVTMVVFGGMASTFGAVVGAAVLTTLPQLLTMFTDFEMVVFGALSVEDNLRLGAHARGRERTAQRLEQV